jgi:hypothetical protein
VISEDLKKEVMDWINSSALVNVVDDAYFDNYTPPKFVPMFHPLFFLDLPIGSGKSKNPLKSTIEGFFNRTVDFKEEDVLEKMYYDLLLLRIEALKNTESQCTFGELIGFKGSDEPFRCKIDFSNLTVKQYYINIDSHVSKQTSLLAYSCI